MKAGDPVDLSDLVALPRTQAVINQATDRIMNSMMSARVTNSGLSERDKR